MYALRQSFVLLAVVALSASTRTGNCGGAVTRCSDPRLFGSAHTGSGRQSVGRPDGIGAEFRAVSERPWSSEGRPAGSAQGITGPVRRRG